MKFTVSSYFTLILNVILFNDVCSSADSIKLSVKGNTTCTRPYAARLQVDSLAVRVKFNVSDAENTSSWRVSVYCESWDHSKIMAWVNCRWFASRIEDGEKRKTRCARLGSSLEVLLTVMPERTCNGSVIWGEWWCSEIYGLVRTPALKAPAFYQYEVESLRINSLPVDLNGPKKRIYLKLHQDAAIRYCVRNVADPVITMTLRGATTTVFGACAQLDVTASLEHDGAVLTIHMNETSGGCGREKRYTYVTDLVGPRRDTASHNGIREDISKNRQLTFALISSFVCICSRYYERLSV